MDVLFLGGDKRERTADLLNAMDRAFSGGRECCRKLMKLRCYMQEGEGSLVFLESRALVYVVIILYFNRKKIATFKQVFQMFYAKR